jgi:hypothetical protein
VSGTLKARARDWMAAHGKTVVPTVHQSVFRIPARGAPYSELTRVLWRGSMALLLSSVPRRTRARRQCSMLPCWLMDALLASSAS